MILTRQIHDEKTFKTWLFFINLFCQNQKSALAYLRCWVAQWSLVVVRVPVWHTVFPKIVSAETIFLLWNENLNSYLTRVRKLFKGGNYSREETIRGNMVSAFLHKIPFQSSAATKAEF